MLIVFIYKVSLTINMEGLLYNYMYQISIVKKSLLM